MSQKPVTRTGPTQAKRAAVEVDPAKKLLTVEEVAAQLRISRFTVWRLRDRGEFAQPIRIGGARRWTQADVDAYLEANRCLPDDGGLVRRRHVPKTA